MLKKNINEAFYNIETMSDSTKEVIEDIAKDDYSMSHKTSAVDLIDYIYGDDEISSKLARKAYKYYCDVYSELESHSENDDYFDDEFYENKKRCFKESSDGLYKMRFTTFMTVEFTALSKDTVKICFVNNEDKKCLSTFEIFIDDVDWFDDRSVCDIISKEMIVPVLSNYLDHYKDDYDFMGDVCNDVKQLAGAFENLLKNSALDFSQYVIDLFDLKYLD